MAQQLTANRLGGSMIATVMGLSPWQSPYQLWRTMTGRADRVKAKASSRYIEWGIKLEPVIREHYAEIHSVSVIVPAKSIDHGGWARVTPDGLVCEPGTGAITHGLEIKTASHGQAWCWTKTKVPIEYEMQCRWGMWICGLERWDLVVLIGGNDYREYTIERDPATEQDMVEAGRRFMQYHVAQDVPPEPTTCASSPIDLRLDQIRGVRCAAKELALVEQQLERELGDALDRDSQALAIMQEL